MFYDYGGWLILTLLVVSCVGKTGANTTTDALAENVTQLSIAEPIRPNWDSHIKDLEHLLEVDLAQMEHDAEVALYLQEQPNGTLTADLMHIRLDIDRLVTSIKEIEEELGKTKHKIDEDEHNVHQMSAEVETERFLDGLHRGKFDVKVDYVTGELVSKKGVRAKNRLKSQRRKRTRSNKSRTMEWPESNSSTLMMENANQGWESSEFASKITSAIDEVVNAGTQEGSTDDDQFLAQQKFTSETLRQHIESHPDIMSRIKEQKEFLKSGHDPAVIKFDTHLMLNIVKLAMTASLFGLAAVFLKLPPTAGFLLGGMLIGPSCLDMLGEIHQVQTLAQFGAIFLLFEQGLLYAQTYSDDHLSTGNESFDAEISTMIPSIPNSATRDEFKIHSRFSQNQSKRIILSMVATHHPPSFLDVDDGHDPTVVGFIILTLLVFVGLSLVFFANVADTVVEAIMVSSTIAVCSTTIVAETLTAAHIADTSWGIGVLKMISTHDLFMVPLLALPELLSSLIQADDSTDDETFDSMALWGVISIMGKLVLVAFFLKGSTFIATHIIGLAIIADGHLMNIKGELFTLSVVAYALMIATVSEELSMSIEAGAVLAGIALFSSPHVPKVISSIQPITSVFGGMYLTSLGMIISPAFVLEEAGSIIKLVFLIGLFKFALVSASLNRFFGYGIIPSIAVGSAMAQISEVSLLVLAKSQHMGLIPRKTYLMLIPTTFIMLTLAPLSASMLRRLPRVHGHESSDEISLYHCFQSCLRFLHRLNSKKRRASNFWTSSNKSEGNEVGSSR